MVEISGQQTFLCQPGGTTISRKHPIRLIDCQYLKGHDWLLSASEQQSQLLEEIELDGSFFASRRVKEKCGRGVFGKTIAFSVFKRNGKVYTEIVPDCFKTTSESIIRNKIGPKA